MTGGLANVYTLAWFFAEPGLRPGVWVGYRPVYLNITVPLAVRAMPLVNHDRRRPIANGRNDFGLDEWEW
jgi:hypothetical protein